MEVETHAPIDRGIIGSDFPLGTDRLVVTKIFPDRLCPRLSLRPVPLLVARPLRTHPRHHQPLRPALQLPLLQRWLPPRASRPPRNPLAPASPSIEIRRTPQPLAGRAA